MPLPGVQRGYDRSWTLSSHGQCRPSQPTNTRWGDPKYWTVLHLLKSTKGFIYSQKWVGILPGHITQSSFIHTETSTTIFLQMHCSQGWFLCYLDHWTLSLLRLRLVLQGSTDCFTERFLHQIQGSYSLFPVPPTLQSISVDPSQGCLVHWKSSRDAPYQRATQRTSKIW